MRNHAQITVFGKPQVKKSRGFLAQSNHGRNHANHDLAETAGQEITQEITALTTPVITNPTVPLGTGVRILTPRQELSMARNRRSARAAGTRSERAVADYLAAQLEDDRIDRRVKTGARDRGDISGIRVHNQRVVVKVKDCATAAIPEWTAEAHAEAGNDDALVGVVVAKRRGTTDPGRWWVHCTVDDLLALLSGERHGHRRDFGDFTHGEVS
jgi:hypothetical protein